MERWKRGSAANRRSQTTVAAVPTTPATSGATVAALSHACCTPPHETATSTLVADPMNSAPPAQSTRRSFAPRLSVRARSVSSAGTAASPYAQIGNLEYGVNGGRG